jgi:NTE family protein
MAKRALVLAGGGARGSYQVGMLHELIIEQGLDFQIFRGVSVGALNTSFLAQAAMGSNSLSQLQSKVRQLETIWTKKIEGNHSVYYERGGFASLALGADSLYSFQPLITLVKDALSLAQLRQSGRDFQVGTVSLVSGRYEEWPASDPLFFDKLVASASIPVIFPFVDLKKKKDVLVDGGVRNMTPLSSAFQADPDEIYVLLTSRLVRKGDQLPDSAAAAHDYKRWCNNWLGTNVTGMDVLARTLDLLSDEVYLGDIRGALEWNDVLGAIEEVQKAAQGASIPAGLQKALDTLSQRVTKRHVDLYVLAPREWYGDKNDSTDFSPSLIQHAIEHGQTIARNRSLWVWPPGLD